MVQFFPSISIPLGFALQIAPVCYPLFQRVNSTALKMLSSLLGTSLLFYSTTKAPAMAAVAALPATYVSMVRLLMRIPEVQIEDTKSSWMLIAFSTALFAGIKSPLNGASEGQMDSCVSILAGFTTSVIGFVLDRAISQRLARLNYQDLEIDLEEIQIPVNAAPAA